MEIDNKLPSSEVVAVVAAVAASQSTAKQSKHSNG